MGIDKPGSQTSPEFTSFWRGLTSFMKPFLWVTTAWFRKTLQSIESFEGQIR